MSPYVFNTHTHTHTHTLKRNRFPRPKQPPRKEEIIKRNPNNHQKETKNTRNERQRTRNGERRVLLAPSLVSLFVCFVFFWFFFLVFVVVVVVVVVVGLLETGKKKRVAFVCNRRLSSLTSSARQRRRL